MAIKVTRTHGLRVLYEKCGCTATREFEDQALTKPVGETATYVPCAKHIEAKDAAETLSEILFEMLETAQKQAQKMPAPQQHIGHSVADVQAAQAAGAAGATRTPIKRAGAGTGRTTVKRAGGDGGALPAVSTAVMEARAHGGDMSSLDAELARAPEPQGGVRVGPVSAQAVRDAIEEAAETGDSVTPLDVILGANDPSIGHGV
jgi:hypothetical protein